MAHLESLVVFDRRPETRAALQFGFERAGYHVYAAEHPADALAMAATCTAQLVVVALEGAVEDGEALSVVGRLREEAPTRELPVVVVGEREHREEALRAGADEFVARPAFIRDVLTLGRLAVALRQDGDGGGFSGALEDFGLYFLVRALGVARRSAMLELERGARQGELRLSNGELVAARCGRIVDVAAFQQLLLWDEGTLTLRCESPLGERRIHVGSDELLAESVELVREIELCAERVGGLGALYAAEPRRAAQARGRIPSEVMALVRQYDGRKQLLDVLEDSPFKAIDTVKITQRLAEMGVIARRAEPRHVTPLSVQLTVRDWLLGTGSVEATAPRATPPAQDLGEAGRRAAEGVPHAPIYDGPTWPGADEAAPSPPAEATEANAVAADVAPAVAKAAPVAEATVPVTVEAVPVAEATVPVTVEAVPVAEATVPVTVEAVPVAEAIAPVAVEATAPVAAEGAPAVEAAAPVAEARAPVEAAPAGAAPVAAEGAPVVEATAPVAEARAPVEAAPAEATAPVAAEAALVAAEATAPRAAEAAPAAEAALAEATASVAEATAPVAEATAPVVEATAPRAAEGAPVAEATSADAEATPDDASAEAREPCAPTAPLDDGSVAPRDGRPEAIDDNPTVPFMRAPVESVVVAGILEVTAGEAPPAPRPEPAAAAEPATIVDPAEHPVTQPTPRREFSPEEEDFFAREEELAKTPPAERFDDLDTPPPKPRRGWLSLFKR